MVAPVFATRRRRSAYATQWIYVEQGRSGKGGARQRPLFEQIKRDAVQREFDRLLVWKVSRLGRDMREVIATVYQLADLGVTVIPIKSQTGPISSTMGKLLWAIKVWYAEMENSERSETIRAGQARARAVGKEIGRPKAVFRGLVVELRQQGSSLAIPGKESSNRSGRACAVETHLASDSKIPLPASGNSRFSRVRCYDVSKAPWFVSELGQIPGTGSNRRKLPLFLRFVPATLVTTHVPAPVRPRRRVCEKCVSFGSHFRMAALERGPDARCLCRAARHRPPADPVPTDSP
jgi:putative DNA-invertase from lambdoid prophage Rac